ncbi:maleylpyruvate isomerase family mycothiol-dependent enzyme [Kocuria sp.]|uniref:maleylpyruvate isomerase family mycothiol-dependent enzyme n=1 Tax=Kocuria sp. TaxID=1871328 RepID=UPI0026DFB71D|nr:maleylpyruvate isomerase family mycothiol-dependent enzyme [Kocuria sp.]MDO5617209.1 maleylpyruvate isomerase family mycothiol-dependent enzyme [Kocuria sp.]
MSQHSPARLRSDLSRLERETEQYLSTVESFHDHEFTHPSLCDGWSRADVVAHVAVVSRRLVRLIDWAETGNQQAPYDSAEERAQLIAETAALSPAELKAEARAAIQFFLENAPRLLAEPAVEELALGRKRFAPHQLPGVMVTEIVLHHADLDTQWEIEEADPDSVRDALEAAVRTMQVKNAPGMHIVTDERDEWTVGDGALRVEGDREGILAWLARGDAENVYLPEGVEAPELPAW